MPRYLPRRLSLRRRPRLERLRGGGRRAGALTLPRTPSASLLRILAAIAEGDGASGRAAALPGSPGGLTSRPFRMKSRFLAANGGGNGFSCGFFFGSVSLAGRFFSAENKENGFFTQDFGNGAVGKKEAFPRAFCDKSRSPVVCDRGAAFRVSSYFNGRLSANRAARTACRFYSRCRPEESRTPKRGRWPRRGGCL